MGSDDRMGPGHRPIQAGGKLFNATLDRGDCRPDGIFHRGPAVPLARPGWRSFFARTSYLISILSRASECS